MRPMLLGCGVWMVIADLAGRRRRGPRAAGPVSW